MTTRPNPPAIGATVNETDGTVSITANGLEVATINLRHRFSNIEVHMVSTQYYAPSDRGHFGRVQFGGSPSFSSEPTIHELPESVLVQLASIVGINVIKDEA